MAPPLNSKSPSDTKPKVFPDIITRPAEFRMQPSSSTWRFLIRILLELNPWAAHILTLSAFAVNFESFMTIEGLITLLSLLCTSRNTGLLNVTLDNWNSVLSSILMLYSDVVILKFLNNYLMSFYFNCKINTDLNIILVTLALLFTSVAECPISRLINSKSLISSNIMATLPYNILLWIASGVSKPSITDGGEVNHSEMVHLTKIDNKFITFCNSDKFTCLRN